MRNKKILIISAVFPPEPVVSSQLSLDIATELSKNKAVVVLSPKPTRPYNYTFEHKDTKHPFEHIITNSYTCPKSSIFGRLRESYSFGKKCVEYIRNNYSDIDCIYQNSWPLFAQFMIVKAAKRYRISIITHVQDIYPESFTNKLSIGGGVVNSVLLPIDKFILENSTKVLCISENMRNQLQKSRKISSEKFEVLANWQDEENFIKYQKNNDTIKQAGKTLFTFMYLGNNGPVAGVDFLIRVFHKAQIPNSQLIIAGSGSKTESCKELVRKLGVENVIFAPVPDGKVPEMQAQSDVMLLPVKSEGAMSSIPSKLPAYMFSAKPIIGSLDLESDTARAIRYANCGIVVEPENEDLLAKAMKDISSWDKKEINEKGLNGFNYAIENFSRENNLKRLIEIITNVK